MSWYKKAQFNEENTQNIDTPLIMVQPYEPLVQEAIDELYQQNPNFFKGVNKVNIDMGFGQFGSVSSTDPSDININIANIRSNVNREFQGQFDINNPEHKKHMLDVIKRVLVHEKAHVSDAIQAQEISDISLSGEELFPGGEGVAETAEQKFTSSNKITKTASYDFKNQQEMEDSLGDFQRYIFDAYNTKVYLTKTKKKISVSCLVTNSYVGTIILNSYWDFDKDKENEAKKVFGKVKKIVKDTMADYVDNEKPTSMYYASLRKGFQKINNRDIAKTNIPWINYSYDIDYEDDWRSTIYGNRYPKYEEKSFNQSQDKDMYDPKNYNKNKFFGGF